MVSVTVSIPEKVKQKMEHFSEINWSGLVRKIILQKTEELSKREELEKQLKGEDITNWAVKMQYAGRKGRLEALRKKGFI